MTPRAVPNKEKSLIVGEITQLLADHHIGHREGAIILAGTLMNCLCQEGLGGKDEAFRVFEVLIDQISNSLETYYSNPSNYPMRTLSPRGGEHDH